jgi:hypothetical protein
MRRRTRPSRLRKNSKNARKGKGTTGVPIAPGFGAMGWRSSTRAAKSLKIDSGFRVCVRTHFHAIWWREVQENPAPEGRTSLAPRFSAG